MPSMASPLTTMGLCCRCCYASRARTSVADNESRRYLRARKFDVQGAIGQFTDTEKWMKEQHVEELYEHFDVDFYERARVMVCETSNARVSELTSTVSSMDRSPR